MTTNQNNQTLSFYLLLLTLFTIPLCCSFLYAQQNLKPQTNGAPIEVSVSLRVNKIYNINSVDETYQIDGYMLYSWVDERLKFTPNDSIPNIQIYENDSAKALINTSLWVPVFEFINVQGSKDTPNLSIEIHADGTIDLEERFFDTFSSNMNYKKFPFDQQEYCIEIETFSYDSKKLIFKNPKLFFEGEKKDYLGEDWEFISSKAEVLSNNYEYSHNEKNTYSRVHFGLLAKRLSGYYLWQVLFPLLIIILASFSIFWIEDFSTQIGIGFTLMLTVVAFNFYSASILPKLSYNTFIEYVIIVGYLFILFGIIAVIINHRLNDINKQNIPLIKYFRYTFPIAYFIIMAILYTNLIV
ncbi:hypothetical protein ACFFU1_17745 [Algibacter miyuki]|uniref:Neurotransmitter-gated ion-channel ligand-binding domain-containing protein n=1 Tax=Algibacter miyuki TaxID=1306933 RepID=A0ABV5H4R5_9FLAO|nr:hypothetical protein [Algibacter miyuki]MDN3663808.1 hypothetical protein [Algibacter miyuki]